MMNNVFMVLSLQFLMGLGYILGRLI